MATTSTVKLALAKKLQEHQGKKQTAAPSTNGKPAEAPSPPPPPRKPPDNIEAYYESNKSHFWAINGKEQWQRFNSDELACMLKLRGYYGSKFDGMAYSEVDEFLHKIRFWNSVDWAGELAGWDVGKRQIAGMDVLITRSRQPIKPKRGSYPLIRAFLSSLLGKVQLPYFLGWLKGSLEALKDGHPFRPGQLVAFAGHVNSGKSFAQILVTAILGGRQGDPTEYLLGNTTFNGDFIRAEHLCIEDKALKDFTSAKRRALASNLKALIVNQDQRIRALFKEASLLPVCCRVTLSCNDAPEALAILPSLDSDVADKVIYFLCGEGELPMRRRKSLTRREQYNAFLAELPALIWWLNHHTIAMAITDPGNRFSVAAYHHPEIVRRLQDLTAEQRLLQLLEVLPLQWPDNGIFEGTAAQIEQWMRASDEHRLLDRILTYNASMGYLLSKIAKDGEERIKLIGTDDRKNRYRISKEEL